MLIYLIGDVRDSKKTKCKRWVKMVGKNVFQYSEHNYDEDDDTEKIISMMMQLRSDIKTLGVLRPDEKPVHIITECLQNRGVCINERQSSNRPIIRALNRRRKKCLNAFQDQRRMPWMF